MKASHKPKKNRIYASKYKFPNINRKASVRGKGDGNNTPGWKNAIKYWEGKLDLKLIYIGPRKGQWCFEKE